MRTSTLIAGGGIAGLACARELHARGGSYVLVEREKEPGGLCRSVEREGFTFDYTGHFLHFRDASVRAWVSSLAPGLFKPRSRRAAIHSRGTYTEYPYQENSAGLPSEVARENVLGFLEARLRERAASRSDGDDFESWARGTFGEGIARHFLLPYNAKLWKHPLSRLTTRWMGRFVPRPSLRKVLEGAFRRRPSDSGYNATFLYPDRGGIGNLPRLLARGLPGIFTGVELVEVDLRRRRARLSTGFTVEYERLVTSLPLPAFARRCRDLPAPLSRAAAALKVVSVYNVNLGLRVPRPIPYSWVYFPETRFRFHRAGSVSACVPTVAPRGGSTLYLEYSYRGRRPDPRTLGREALRDLEHLGWISGPRDVAVRVDLDLPTAYVIYDGAREEAVGLLHRHLRKMGVLSIGRYGNWEYGSMESALVQGREAAQAV